MNIVFLAAGKSSRIFKILKKPKCLLEINNKPLIEILIKNFSFNKNNKINIVLGFKPNLIKKKLVRYKKINYIFNKDYNKKEMLHSMILALKKIDDDIVLSYSDIIYDQSICKKICKSKKEIHLPILSDWKKVWIKRKKNIYQDAEELKIDKKNNLIKIGDKIKDLKKVHYQYMGLLFIPNLKRKKIISLYNQIKNKKKMHLKNFLNFVIKKDIKIKCIKYKKNWYEFDDIDDFNNYL